MNTGFMTGTLVFAVSGTEMTTMVRCIKQYCVVPQAFFFQCIYQISYIFVQTMALPQIVRIIFLPVSLSLRHITRRSKIAEKFFTSVRSLKPTMVILMMWFDLRNEQKEWVFPLILMQIMDRIIINSICTISYKFVFFPSFIKNISIITVGSSFQYIGSHPIVPITTPPVSGTALVSKFSSSSKAS